MNASTDFAAARRAMIDSQLRPSGVTDPQVVARMAAVPREDFLPAERRAAAYADRAVRLDEGGALAAPLFYGMLLAEAQPRADDRVLVIDGGSGYLAALVAPLVAACDSIAPAAALKAGKTRYSLVLIDGAIEHAPAALARRLEDDGRIVTGWIDKGVTRLATGRPSGDALAFVPLAEVGIPRLPAFDKPAAWTF